MSLVIAKGVNIMNLYHHFIGIDVSKENLDVFILPDSKHLSFTNNKSKIQSFIQKLKKLPSCLIVFEASGGYEYLLAYSFSLNNIPFVLENPAKIRHFAKAKGVLAKTDKIDSKIIAQYAQAILPQPKVFAHQTILKLRAFVTRYRQLNKMRLAEKNRFNQVIYPEIKAAIQTHISSLNSEIDTLMKTIKQIINSDPELVKKDKLLCSVKGVGPVTSAVLIANFTELGQLSRKQAASLAGVAPFNNNSGSRKGHKSIKGGRHYVRRILFMAILSATRHNLIISQYYKRVLACRNIKKVALIACVRKLLVILNAMIKNNTTWNPQYVPNHIQNFS
jgi:transposase